jgi:hypothetical protein
MTRYKNDGQGKRLDTLGEERPAQKYNLKAVEAALM